MIHWFEAGPLHALQKGLQKSQLLFAGFSNLLKAVQVGLHSFQPRYSPPVQESQSVVAGPTHVKHVASQASQVLVPLFG